MKKYLFFDTETTGVPANYKAPLTNFYNWPRLVQLAMQLIDENGMVISKANYIVKPFGFEIPQGVSKIHGITQAYADEAGMSVLEVLSDFSMFCKQADTFVCHNTGFDRKIVGSELLRNNMEDVLHGKGRHCTMMESTNYCKLPGPYGYKWPKLQELYQFLFNKPFSDVHNAASDIQATIDCFFELRKRGVIS